MRSGPIRPEAVEEKIDRSEEVLPLWERGGDSGIDLPWPEASGPAALGDIQPLLAEARSAVLVVGSTKTSLGLLNVVLRCLAAPRRLYVYGDRTLEADAALVRRLACLGDRVLVRLGHPPPADWIVTDQGRTGRIVMGATSHERRWVVPVEGPLARSLFEAFRSLFWFHTSREALPDTEGDVAFREPLDAPFEPPGTDLPLAAGRLRLDGDLDDPILNAEIRISSDASNPGRARVLFVPPTGGGLAKNGTGSSVALDLPMELCRRGHRVVWADTGLPKTAVTHRRLIMDLVEPPIALQIEWPRVVAIDLCHRLDRAAKDPAWEFHPERRLGDVKGQVLLERAKQGEKIIPHLSLDAGDVEASLPDFAAARPARFPDVPPLAREVTVRWRRAPAALPSGARAAEIVRGWKAVDEWAARTVESCRAVLDELESREGKWTRLRRWFPSRDGNALAQERGQLRDEIDEIGESPPSKMAEQAKERMERLARIGGRLNELRRTDYDQRQMAEEAQAEEAQRSAWERRIGNAGHALEEVRSRLAKNEEAQGEARKELQAARDALDAGLASRRQERKDSLEQERIALEAELEAARSHRKSREVRSSRSARKEADRRVRDTEKKIARNKRDHESVADWSPSKEELGDVHMRFAEAEEKVSSLQAEAGSLSEEIGEHDRAASEEFRFEKPNRLPASPPANEVNPPPAMPEEELPELGDLYEHRGVRFLTIRTWEQLEPAKPVAARLAAELVIDAGVSKA